MDISIALYRYSMLFIDIFTSWHFAGPRLHSCMSISQPRRAQVSLRKLASRIEARRVGQRVAQYLDGYDVLWLNLGFNLLVQWGLTRSYISIHICHKALLTQRTVVVSQPPWPDTESSEVFANFAKDVGPWGHHMVSVDSMMRYSEYPERH